nr:LysR family transcriptional regulator [Burkholderia arboris]
MDLQLLRLFLTIVESGGFSAAQGTLGMAPSTISTQMAKLETRLGSGCAIAANAASG